MLHFTVIVKSIINLQNDASGHNLKCEAKTIKKEPQHAKCMSKFQTWCRWPDLNRHDIATEGF